MGRSRAEKSYDWAALARQSAKEVGFEDVTGLLLRGEAFKLGGAVSPCVQVFFQRVTNTDIAPFAFLGVFVEEFEGDWGDRLLRTRLPAKSEDTPFCLYVANIAGLRPRPWCATSPSDQHVAAMQGWLVQVFDYARRRLPSSMTSLVAAVEADRIADHPIWAYLGHPVKVRGFVEWLRRTQGVDVGEHVLPLLDDRTEPYDVRVMLGAD